jgi:hypothetical protein
MLRAEERLRVESPDQASVPAGLALSRSAGWPALDAHLAAIHAGKLDLTLAPLISARGRRPAAAPPALG